MKRLYALLFALLCALPHTALAEKMSFKLEGVSAACKPAPGCTLQGDFEFTVEAAAAAQVSSLVIVTTWQDYIRLLAESVVKEIALNHSAKEWSAKSAPTKFATEIKNRLNESLKADGASANAVSAVKIEKLTAQ